MIRPNAVYYCKETDANNSIDSITVRVLEGFLTVYADVSNRKLQLVTDGFRVHVFLEWIVPALRERERERETDTFLAPRQKHGRVVLTAETNSCWYPRRGT